MTHQTPPTDYVIFTKADLVADRAPADGDPIVVVELTPPTDTHATPNTIIIDWASRTPVRLIARSVDGERISTSDAIPGPIMDGLLPSTAVTLAAAAVSPSRTYDGLAPVAVARAVPAGDRHEVHIYQIVDRSLTDGCYIRITAEPLEPAIIDGAQWLTTALHTLHRSAVALNNHQMYFTKAFPGQELEYKFTLPPAAPIYTLALAAATEVRAGGLPGFVLAYRDEFESWDYVSTLYRIDAPDEARGYVSFIATAVGGRVKQKRKWFTQDTLARREEITDLGELATPYEDYLRDELRVTATRMPRFRRIRYDITVESLATGNIFGVLFDRCTVIDHPNQVMCQCEIEYIRSRRALPIDQRTCAAELDHVLQWTSRLLAGHGIDADPTFYSKLSFLQSIPAQATTSHARRAT